MVDRFSNWPIIWKASNSSAVDWLTNFCSQFGVPEEISTDGGPEFTSGAMAGVMEEFGIKHRVSSAYHPHSNMRAELGVKAVKRALRNNVDSDGNITNSRMVAALLALKNTPDRDTRMSPAEYVFGRPVNDLLPTGDNWTDSFGDDWKRTMQARELAVAGRHERCYEKLNEHTKQLPPLMIGDHVAIQNQHGNNPLKWEKRGVVISIEGFDKYGIKVIGSGRLTYRNRQHLRAYLPESLENMADGQPDVQLDETAMSAPDEPVLPPPQPQRPTVGDQFVQVSPTPDTVPEPQAEYSPPPPPPQATHKTIDLPMKATATPVRRSSRSTAGKTSKFDDYQIDAMNTLLHELPQQGLINFVHNLFLGGGGS